MFWTLGTARSFNVIDHLLIEDAVRDNESRGAIIKSRAQLDKQYGRIGKGDNDEFSMQPSGNSQLNYVDQTEDGFVGLEPPVG